MSSIFAEATRKAASARFKQPQLDAEGQEIEVWEYGVCGRVCQCGCVCVCGCVSRWISGRMRSRV